MSGERPGTDEAARPLASVIGNNAHRLRGDAGLTLDQVSRAARKRGLNWSESRVADFERGKVAPNLATLVAVCLALGDAGCAQVNLPALLHSALPIQVNESLWLSSEHLTNVLGGRPARKLSENLSPESLTAAINSAFEAALPLLTEIPGATEERTSKALDIDTAELADLSVALWNRTFSEERDRRAGEGANAQKRGQVTRQMRAELEEAMKAPKHGDRK